MANDISSLVMTIIVGLSVFTIIGIWLLIKTGVVTTPRMERKRKQNEAEEFASMTPEAQQLHLHAQQKVSEFNYSFVMFVITCIISGAFIYWAMK